jgi:hypothetical protein
VLQTFPDAMKSSMSQLASGASVALVSRLCLNIQRPPPPHEFTSVLPDLNNGDSGRSYPVSGYDSWGTLDTDLGLSTCVTSEECFRREDLESKIMSLHDAEPTLLGHSEIK